MIGRPSSGVQTNGNNLVRTVIKRCGATLEGAVPVDVDGDGRIVKWAEAKEITLGEVLLNPTRI